MEGKDVMPLPPSPSSFPFFLFFRSLVFVLPDFQTEMGIGGNLAEINEG